MWAALLDSLKGEEMSKDKFILAHLKREHTDNKKGETVRVSKDAYNTAVDMANESSMSLSQVVSKAIMFAAEHLEYGYEEKEGEE